LAEATRAFFEDLAARGREPLLDGVTGTLRVDLRKGNGADHWLVRVTKGEVVVSRRKTNADCVVTADEALFDRIVLGEMNAVTTVLRGEVQIEGDMALILAFQRLFPGPPPTRERRSHSRNSAR
jgi:putative sterol carrier protein